MSKQQVIIRCDGGRKIGLGHVVRCLALADMLREDFTISFAIQETSDEVKTRITHEGFLVHVLPATEDFEEDLRSFQKLLHPNTVVVLDGYNFRSEYQKSIKNVGCKLVCIDDLHAWHQYADIVINHAGGITDEDYDCEVYTRLLLGYDYALLRKEFLNYCPTTKNKNTLTHFFISMGAGDEGGNTLKFAEALLHWQPTEKIRLMVSTLNPHLESIVHLQHLHANTIEVYFNVDAIQLIELIEKSDLVICPASTIALETCSIGCLLMTGTTAENQRSNLKGIIESEMGIDLGDLNRISKEAFLIRLESIYLNPNNETMLQRQQEKLNATTPARISSCFKNLNPDKSLDLMDVRLARASDLMIYFEWANDPDVRNNSFHSAPITIENHTTWFKENVKSNSIVMFLFIQNNEPIAQVRFRIEKSTALLNYSIDKKYRGRRLSAPIIDRALKELELIKPSLTEVIAEVKPENIASARAFEKNNFEKTSETKEKIVFQFHL